METEQRADDLIYQQLVEELGDPYDSTDIDEANARFVTSKSALTKFVQDMYLAQVEAEDVWAEPKTVEIPIQPSPYRKRKTRGR